MNMKHILSLLVGLTASLGMLSAQIAFDSPVGNCAAYYPAPDEAPNLLACDDEDSPLQRDRCTGADIRRIVAETASAAQGDMPERALLRLLIDDTGTLLAMTTEPELNAKLFEQIFDALSAQSYLPGQVNGQPVCSYLEALVTPSGQLARSREEKPRYHSDECEALPDAAERELCANRTLLQALYSTVRYPVEARELRIQGTVEISFVVERDGSQSGHRITKSIGGGCDEEALRVVKSLGKYVPGKYSGQPVRTHIMLPVKFRLE
jgi:TonB family protein